MADAAAVNARQAKLKFKQAKKEAKRASKAARRARKAAAAAQRDFKKVAARVAKAGAKGVKRKQRAASKKPSVSPATSTPRRSVRTRLRAKPLPASTPRHVKSKPRRARVNKPAPAPAAPEAMEAESFVMGESDLS